MITTKSADSFKNSYLRFIIFLLYHGLEFDIYLPNQASGFSFAVSLRNWN